MKAVLVCAFFLAASLAAPQYAPHGFDASRLSQTPFNANYNKYLPPETTTAAPIVHKQFYLISAQEDAENAEKSKHLVLGKPQKNYRVIFIKAPSGENANVKFSAEYAPQEEKTVIYVLTKKANELNANDIATPDPTPASKPEVFFIKYKTEEEASAAQREIQEQYDALGGTSEFSDVGQAPLTSVVGSLDSIAADGNYDYKPTHGDRDHSANSDQYLPPGFKN